MQRVGRDDQTGNVVLYIVDYDDLVFQLFQIFPKFYGFFALGTYNALGEFVGVNNLFQL